MKKRNTIKTNERTQENKSESTGENVALRHQTVFHNVNG